MRALAAALFCMIAGTAQAGCGYAPAACLIDGGEYHAVLPDVSAGAPVVVFLHGAGGSGGNVVRNAGLMRSFTERGYAVLAPSALPRRAGATGGVWAFYPGWEGRDEPEFLQDMRADAAARFGLDTDNAILSGFSAGGFMVSYLACAQPGLYPAYAPLAGGFWNPLPDRCAGPVRLLQVHGWTDTTVPLEGRPLRQGAFIQGDIFAGLEIWRRANACPNMAPDEFGQTGVFQRRAWTDCDPRSALEFALHPGGHAIPLGWADMMLDWFEAL